MTQATHPATQPALLLNSPGTPPSNSPSITPSNAPMNSPGITKSQPNPNPSKTPSDSPGTAIQVCIPGNMLRWKRRGSALGVKKRSKSKRRLLRPSASLSVTSTGQKALLAAAALTHPIKRKTKDPPGADPTRALKDPPVGPATASKDSEVIEELAGLL